ncbi:sugar phosphate isomerase/epimerase family protein [Tissierella sp. Yu-01]|uniref:sugar phosphate isomerase/epimerase family protein n=1 Tax=Tissierella sp. Yu-01 TaxID=3035694 RepID=UPI00240E717B|nr:sugar phosphate isomerase/epimerase family protein [Tissierella sp. Yu-01]WFA08595.1 sugar phosphate isomerase/epimerase [Tissierella sp. Yu-01]
MKRIVGVNSNSFHGYGIEGAIKGISGAGFRYIELTATKGWTEHVFPNMTFKELHKIKKDLEVNNLIPISLSGHCNLMDEERIDDFILNIKLAYFFGCKFIISSIGEAHLEDKTEVTDEVVAEHIKGLIPYLEEYELILCLENHGKHATGKHMKRIIDLIDSDRVLINYDTANAIFYGNVNLEEDIDSCIERIGHMHLKDKAGAADEWNFPALGKGYIDFRMILDKLHEAKNNCPLSIEIEFTQEGPRDLEEINDAVKDSYNYLKNLG